MSKYTSGKWQALSPLIKSSVVFAPSQKKLGTPTVVAQDIPKPADARLIAEAPEMYALLKETLNLLSRKDIDTQLKVDIDACLLRIDGSPLQKVYEEAGHEN